MKITTRLRKAASAAMTVMRGGRLSTVDDSRGWIRLFRYDPDGTFQTDVEITQDGVIAYAPVYSCMTLISSDVGKIALRLMTQDRGIWVETTSPAFSPLLRKPNHFQTRQQFIESWIVSKLAKGNTYILKHRDGANRVQAMYVLDPSLVTPLVAPDGSVYYQCQQDDLSRLPFQAPAIPASEIIHDRMECLFHPLVGISPLWAAFLSASQGLRIQKNSEQFFKNMSRASGLLTAPGKISDETAKRLKEQWEKEFTGDNIGRLAVLGDGLKYESMTINAENAQLVEQLKMSAEQVCATFHVPAYMIGAAQIPSNANVEAMNQAYYSQCLQKLFNAIEDLLDEHLGLAPLGYRTEFDIEDLLRMDSETKLNTVKELRGAGVMSPNEGRSRYGMLPVAGGESPYLQQQNYSLAALAKRDASEDPFGTAAPAPAAPPADQQLSADAMTRAIKAFRDVELEHG